MSNSGDSIADQVEAIIKDQKKLISPPTKMNWKPGDTGYVTIAGKEYAFKILDLAFSSEGDYLQTKLELSTTAKDLSGAEHTQTWVHPRPVQSYKLRQKPRKTKGADQSDEDLWS